MTTAQILYFFFYSPVSGTARCDCDINKLGEEWRRRLFLISRPSNSPFEVQQPKKERRDAGRASSPSRFRLISSAPALCVCRLTTMNDGPAKIKKNRNRNAPRRRRRRTRPSFAYGGERPLAPRRENRHQRRRRHLWFIRRAKRPDAERFPAKQIADALEIKQRKEKKKKIPTKAASLGGFFCSCHYIEKESQRLHTAANQIVLLDHLRPGPWANVPATLLAH